MIVEIARVVSGQCPAQGKYEHKPVVWRAAWTMPPHQYVAAAAPMSDL
jgi:hypothetical protein